MDTSSVSIAPVATDPSQTSSSTSADPTQAQQDAFNQAYAAAQMGILDPTTTSANQTSADVTPQSAEDLICNSIMQQIVSHAMTELDQNRKENEEDDD